MIAMLLVHYTLIKAATVTQFGPPAANFNCQVGYSLTLPIVVTDANGLAYKEATFRVVLPEQLSVVEFKDKKLGGGVATMTAVNDATNRTTVCTIKYTAATPATPATPVTPGAIVGDVGSIVATAKARTPAGATAKLTGSLSAVSTDNESVTGSMSFPTTITIAPRGPSATVGVQ